MAHYTTIHVCSLYNRIIWKTQLHKLWISFIVYIMNAFVSLFVFSDKMALNGTNKYAAAATKCDIQRYVA